MYHVLKRIKPLITNTGPGLNKSLNLKFDLKKKFFKKFKILLFW